MMLKMFYSAALPHHFPSTDSFPPGALLLPPIDSSFKKRQTFIARKVSCFPFDSQSMTRMRDWKFHLVMHQEIAENKKLRKIFTFFSSSSLFLLVMQNMENLRVRRSWTFRFLPFIEGLCESYVWKPFGSFSFEVLELAMKALKAPLELWLLHQCPSLYRHGDGWRRQFPFTFDSPL